MAAEWDVFVSWTRRGDKGGPAALVEALKRRGLSVWFDQDRIGPFDSIADEVRAGLAGSSVLAAWYSPQYPTRRACREELTLALLASERLAGFGAVLAVLPDGELASVVEAPLLAGPDNSVT